MAPPVTRLLHRVVARPVVYELVQRAAGAGRVRQSLERLLAELGPSGVVLDVGGGTGLYRGLWGNGWRYLCLDNDPEKLDGFAAGQRRDFAILGSAGALPLRGGSIDAVLCTAVSHHLTDEELSAFVRESARILKPGGALVFLDAVWRPRRIPSRVLWALDRGAHPRTREEVLGFLGERFTLVATQRVSVLHEYVATNATPVSSVGATGPSLPTRTRARAGETYDPSYFDRLFAIEDRHFWFRARNRVITKLVAQTVGLRTDLRAIEVGCGTGTVLAALQNALPRALVVGMDLHEEGLRLARTRTRAALVRGAVEAPPFEAIFDVVGVFDVLEHLVDDEGALRRLRALVAPDGVLLVTVPAHRALWSYFDEASRHRRRYAPEELRHTLVESGFEVDYLSQFMAPLVVPMWAGRRIGRPVRRWRRNATADELAAEDLRVVRGANELMDCLLWIESLVLARRIRLPVGTSLVAVARPAPAEGLRS